MDYIYRVGRYTVDAAGHRCMFTETYATTDPEINDVQTRGDLLNIGNKYDTTFSTDTWWQLGVWGQIAERLLPTRHCFQPLNLARRHGPRQLNPGAPEAAFRLRRVGGYSGRIGRICFPILSDDYFIDLPHRRHILPTITLPSWTQSGSFGGDPNVYYGYGRVYYNALVLPENYGWEPIVEHVLMPTVIRVWARNRVYVENTEPTRDAVWVPPEKTHITG